MSVLNGTDGRDNIHGGIGDDRISGGAGNDDLYGDYGYTKNAYPEEFTGDDVIYGGDGDDRIFGDGFVIYEGDHGQYEALGGRDELHGGGGADLIVGGPGADNLYGDAGSDVFVFDFVVSPPEYPGPSNFDSGLGAGRDVIRDFEVGVDRIDINGARGVTVSQYHSDWALVKIDVDGDGRTDAQILVHTGTQNVTWADLF